MGDYSSLYKYEKFEIIGDELVPLGIFSVDGNGTMPIVVKDDCDPQCGCPQPIYQWIQTEDTICVYVPPTPLSAKFRLTLSDSTTVSAECDSTSAITSGEVSSQYSGTVVSAEIGNCVTSIGDRAFNRCTGLTNCTIGSGVTSIGSTAFSECYYLENIVIPNSVTNIGDWAFSHCVSLSDITILDSVTSIGSYAFDTCERATGITIGNGIATIGYASFLSCRSATTLTIGNNVTSIGDYAFNNCEALTSITIPNSVTTIGEKAFNACLYTTSLTIGSGVTSIGEGAFGNCPGFTSITILATTPPTLAYEYEFFDSNCPIYVPCESVSAYQAATNWSTYSSRIEGIPPCGQPTPSGNKFTLTLSDSSTVTAECDSTSAVTSGEVATQYSGSVVSAVIGDCVTSIGRNAFRQCGSLTSVTIPNNVTNIDRNAFYICTGLTSISVPHSVTTIGNYAFERCTSTTSCTIGSGVTSIGDAAFSGCTSLTSVTCLATTPPTLTTQTTYYRTFENTNDCPIYVPAQSVNAYKSDSRWSTYASRIQPIT